MVKSAIRTNYYLDRTLVQEWKINSAWRVVVESAVDMIKHVHWILLKFISIRCGKDTVL